jgi:serine O-acetyltransferase
MIDHGTGVVIGETAVIGSNCSFLHGVTLGGTRKLGGNRHPKLGNDVLVGCGATLLGNIEIASNAKIGSGSVVLTSLPG